MFKKPMMHSELNKILWRINQNIEQFEEDGLILWEGLEDIIKELGGNPETFRDATNLPSQMMYVQLLLAKKLTEEHLK